MRFNESILSFLSKAHAILASTNDLRKIFMISWDLPDFDDVCEALRLSLINQMFNAVSRELLQKVPNECKCYKIFLLVI